MIVLDLDGALLNKKSRVSIKSKEYLNINNDEIIAFSDGLNDIDMLKKMWYWSCS